MAEGTGEGNGTGAGTGNQGESPKWLEQLPADLKGNAAFGSFKTIGDFAKAHLDMSGKVTELEGVKAKFDALPKAPAKPEDYQFDPVEGLDVNMLNDARPEFHKLGLTNDQAKAMVALEGALWKKRVDAFETKFNADKAAEETKLKAEWGDKYDTRIENMKRFLTTFSKDFKVDGKTVDVGAWLNQSGMGNSPFFIRLVDALAQKFPEDSSPSGRSGDSGDKKGMISLYQ